MRAMHLFAVVAFASMGVWSCKYEDHKPTPVDKTSVGRVTWPAASGGTAIGGGPPASNVPNATGSEVVPGDEQAKDYAGKVYPPPLTGTSASASAPGGVTSSATSWRGHHGRVPPTTSVSHSHSTHEPH